MDEEEVIRRLYLIKRHSTRWIARERHHSRKTVKKAIMDGGVPRYHLTRAKPCSVMGSYKDIIEINGESYRFKESLKRKEAAMV